MKLHPLVDQALEDTGLTYEILMGGSHFKIRVNGRLVGIYPKNKKSSGIRAMKNLIAQIRRAARWEDAMTTFGFSDTEIENTTGYIKDDRYIASIYGCSEYRVKRLRERKESREPKGMKHENLTMYCSAQSDDRYREKMARGSHGLLKAIEAYHAGRSLAQ